MPDDVLAWNALGTTVENLKSNLEHWIREERLRALERQTDAEVASTQVVHALNATLKRTAEGSWEQRLSSLLREVQSVQKDFAEVKDLLRSADSDLAEELLPKEEDLVSLVTKFLEQMASKKEKSKSESEEEKEEKKGKGKKDKDQKKNKGEKEEEKEEKVEKDQSKGPRKGSAKKHRKKRRRSKKDRDDLSGSYSYSRSPSPRKRRRHRRHRRHRRRCSESSYDSASRKGRRKHRKGRRKERRKGSEGIDVDAEIDRFVKVNKLEERCEKILRDLESSVALKVMGLSPGSSHTFELSGDVRDPTAVVLARVRKAQFAKEIHGLPALLETPDGDIVVRGDQLWQYWKFVWRSTLVTGVTTGNLLARAVRVALKPEQAFRRIFSIFSFGTIFVNVQAVHVLCGPNHLLHRATPFSNFVKLSHNVPEILQDTTEMPPIRAITEPDAWEKLHPTMKTLPFYADGRLLWGAIRKFVEEVSEAIPFCDAWQLEDGKMVNGFEPLREAFLNETFEAHYHVDARMEKYTQAEKVCETNFVPMIKHRALASSIDQGALAMPSDGLAVTIFVVTGFHRHVGFVGDYYGDPGLATMSWKKGEPYGRPRQHMIMSVVNVFTSMKQPLLKEDYTHLFKGIEHEEVLIKAWRNFQQNLKEEIDRRNEKREIKNINMSPKVVESAVSK
eukprot:g25604.t1